MRRFDTSAGLPAAPAAFLAFGSALFVSFLYYLATWSLPHALGRPELAARLNPFALPRGVAEGAPLLSDPLFWASFVASNLLVLALPAALVRLLHRGAAAPFVLSFWGLVLAMNLLFQGHHLGPAYGAAHRAAYLLDLAGGLAAAALGARAGDAFRRRTGA